MKRLAAGEARRRFSEMLDKAQREPVTIEKKGRPVAVVVSLEDHRRFEALEDAAWGTQAARAEKEGFIGKKASEQLLKELLHAED